MAKKSRAAPKGKAGVKAKPRPRSFEDLLAAHAAPLADVCRALRDLVRATLPDAQEGIYGGAKVGLALYSVAGGKKVICGIQPSGSDCLFYLHYLQPEDSPRLKLAGQGKHARHIRISNLDGRTSNELTTLLRLARSRS